MFELTLFIALMKKKNKIRLYYHFPYDFGQQETTGKNLHLSSLVKWPHACKWNVNRTSDLIMLVLLMGSFKTES